MNGSEDLGADCDAGVDVGGFALSSPPGGIATAVAG
jgi:hypothetical protein